MDGIENQFLSRYDRLVQMSAVRDQLRKSPELHYLFLELTDRCNLRCLHCGSRCDFGNRQILDADTVISLIRSVAAHEPSVHICLTGGEPLLHPELEKIACELQRNHLFWSVITNGTLVDVPMASLLNQYEAYSVSISLDGLEAEHNRLRQSSTAYKRAIRGIRHLVNFGIPVQITTVVTKRTIHQLDALEELVRSLGVSSWKLVNIEPIGRALDNQNLLLDRNEFLQLLDFIRSKRETTQRQERPMDITFGCSHLLPPRYEEEVRITPFICGAGILIASVQCNGDISACLDIERHPELVQGNVYHDSFWEIWSNKFQFYRQDRTHRSEQCKNCPLHTVCGGDSLHTWDFERNMPRLCVLKSF